MPDNEAERIIDRMKEDAGLDSDRELAQELGIDPSAISAWKRRGNVPKKYRRRFTISAHKIAAEMPMGPSFFDLRNGYIFALVGLAAQRLRDEVFHLASDEFQDVWYGFRLFKLQRALEKLFEEVPVSDTDSLNRTYSVLRAKIAKGDVAGWIESLPNPRW